MCEKKSMKEILRELKPIVDEELNAAMENDPNSMRNILKRMRDKKEAT